mmetsp:Transcript_18719/g.30347  ORF Transcript_18719/g.30347 Transcript_18719/m.30347 type:complete len:151 (+) Transcript_18719:45-497(+)|eukprot:CAMPEP_0169104714 /NCGR_PEP_ID=MMETSP1015-20121227/23411_1 /TAXON_ID=342587 /ORGANISM="Karlodinium micrum, Strain CCMP2283" /LENGTH=150 /DNA_ID=CAMNT_0009166027 /DNA_START=38 /DNA_END=490 /DNA_ORIENTATION=+
MCRVALTLVCLACIGYIRRVQAIISHEQQARNREPKKLARRSDDDLKNAEHSLASVLLALSPVTTRSRITSRTPARRTGGRMAPWETLDSYYTLLFGGLGAYYVPKTIFDFAMGTDKSAKEADAIERAEAEESDARLKDAFRDAMNKRMD